MRLINIEEALHAVEHELDMIDHVPQWVSDRLVKALRGVPTIDAVQVIRCKDCKQCRKTILFGHFATVCDYWIKLTDEDGYCHHAERKEE